MVPGGPCTAPTFPPLSATPINSTHPPTHPPAPLLAPLQYKTKFPELESLVHNPLEYARVVQVGGVGPSVLWTASWGWHR